MEGIGPSRGINIPEETIAGIRRHAERNSRKLEETISVSAVIRIFLDRCNQYTDRTVDSWIKEGLEKERARRKPRERASRSPKDEAHQMTLDEISEKAGLPPQALSDLIAEAVREAMEREEKD